MSIQTFGTVDARSLQQLHTCLATAEAREGRELRVVAPELPPARLGGESRVVAAAIQEALAQDLPGAGDG